MTHWTHWTVAEMNAAFEMVVNGVIPSPNGAMLIEGRIRKGFVRKGVVLAVEKGGDRSLPLVCLGVLVDLKATTLAGKGEYATLLVAGGAQSGVATGDTVRGPGWDWKPEANALLVALGASLRQCGPQQDISLDDALVVVAEILRGTPAAAVRALARAFGSVLSQRAQGTACLCCGYQAHWNEFRRHSGWWKALTGGLVCPKCGLRASSLEPEWARQIVATISGQKEVLSTGEKRYPEGVSSAQNEVHRVLCPRCNTALRLPDKHVDKVRCPKCMHAFRVTEASSERPSTG